MIQYDPHRWLDHLFDVKGSLIPEITLRVPVVHGLGRLRRDVLPIRRGRGHPCDGAHAGGDRSRIAPGIPDELVLRPVLGRAAVVGQHGQRIAEPGSRRSRCISGATRS